MSCNPIINIPCCTDQSSSFDCSNLLFGSSNSSVVIIPDGCNFDFTINPSLLVQTPISVIATNSLTLTTSGVNNHTLQGNVRVSAIAGNALSINPDGLYVPSSSSGLIALTNIGLGHDVFAGTITQIAQIKRLAAGTNISLTSTASDITISAIIPPLVETDTLATVVTRGNIVNLPITIQGLTLSGIPAVGTLADNILVRDGAGIVKTILTSNFLTAEVDTLDTVTDRGATTPNSITVGGLTTAGIVSALTVDATTGNLTTVNATTLNTTTLDATTVDADTGNIITVNSTTVNTTTLNADFVNADAYKANIRSIIVSSNALSTDHTILVDTTAGDVTVTVNTVTLANQLLVIKKISVDANNVIILPTSGTIDGAANVTFATAQQAVWVQSDASNLFTL